MKKITGAVLILAGAVIGGAVELASIGRGEVSLVFILPGVCFLLWGTVDSIRGREDR